MTISLTGLSRESPSVLRIYVFGVGVLLLVQGGLSLIVRAAGRDPHMTTRLLSDPWHAAIHVVWGVLLLAILASSRDPVVVERAAIAFGVFYLSFLVLGLVVHHPFGLMIDGPENVFHAVVGGLALGLGLRELLRRRERAR
jgi:hypothetical protein